MKNVGNSSRERSQGVMKIFRASCIRAHCAVIFAIAQLSCLACRCLLRRPHYTHLARPSVPYSFQTRAESPVAAPGSWKW